MALRMTLRRASRGEGGYTTQEFDVDLYSENEFDFVEYDLESMDTAQALGFTGYDPMLEFYDEYTEGNGFFKLVSKQAKDVFNALEEQGYESFNDGDFSPEQFARVLADVVMYSNPSHQRAQALYLLENFVDFKAADTGPFSNDEYRVLLLAALAQGVGHAESIIETLHPYYQLEEGEVFLDEDGDPVPYDEEYVGALISGLQNAESSEVEPILDELMLFIDKDDVDYDETETTPSPAYGDERWEATDHNTSEFKHTITILDKVVFEWKRNVQNRLSDAITFWSEPEDLSEYFDGHGTPDAARAILSYFDIEESKYDEEHPDSPEAPDHPVSDPEGTLGVLYTRYDYDYSKGELTDDIEKQQLVPYKDESDVNAAIELSSYLFQRDGEEKYWVMRRMERTDPEAEDQQELEEKHKDDPDDRIWDEWRIYWEDAE